MKRRSRSRAFWGLGGQIESCRAAFGDDDPVIIAEMPIGAYRDRTDDLQLAKLALSQLS